MKSICILNIMHCDLLNYQSAMKLSNSLSNPATKFISSSMSTIYTEALTAVCGKSDCLNTPFVTQSFHYILGIL